MAIKKWYIGLIILAVLSILIGACGGTIDTTSPISSPSYVVHLNDLNFVQSSITIPKGQSLTLTNDVSTFHIIDNGTWISNAVHPEVEKGAPKLASLQVNGNSSQQIGPFTVPGTYHFYCTIHPNMNLTVQVN